MGKPEKQIEDYLVEQVKKAGGICRKLKWQGHRGAPDRFVALNGAHFVECKAPGEILQGHQQREIGRLQQHGVNICVVDSKRSIDWHINRWLHETNR